MREQVRMERDRLAGGSELLPVKMVTVGPDTVSSTPDITVARQSVSLIQEADGKIEMQWTQRTTEI